MPDKTVHVILHRKPIDFKGVDRITLVGSSLDGLGTSIPFADLHVDELDIPYEAAKHDLNDGEVPDYIHRFKRLDGYFVDFLIKDKRIAMLVESTVPYGYPAKRGVGVFQIIWQWMTGRTGL
jgi:hypothetical protein